MVNELKDAYLKPNSEDSYLCKVSYDNTILEHKKSEGLFLQPTNVFEPHHPLHVYEICRMFGSESNFNLGVMVARTQVNELLSLNKFYYQPLEDKQIKFFSSVDWISLILELKDVLPNQSLESKFV